MCGCNKVRGETITSLDAQRLIDEAREQALRGELSELESMIASAATASQNANSNASAMR